MKALIIGLAISALFSVFLVFQVDNNLYILKLEELKEIAADCSNSAGLYYDTYEYKNGRKILNKEEANKVIKYLIEKNLKNIYWKDTIDYYVFYFDDS